MIPRTFIIAEAGVNHNGNIDLAKQLIDTAMEAGADAVKFQTFKASSLVCTDTKKANYQMETTSADESQYEMIKKLELPEGAFKELIDYCRTREILFLSSAFDLESIDMLSSLGMEIFKVPSGEITNLPYLRRIGKLKKPVMLSTGMADLGEIESALKVLEEAGTPKEHITVMHCNTEYPTPMDDVNLKAMLSIRKAFKLKIGYSDHTLGIEVPIAAVALGASVIEKHFTLDKTMEGPDHRTSLEPGRLKTMVQAIRNIEQALGDGIKKPRPSEIKNIAIIRKSIVADRNIKKGDIFTEENITVKRPGNGITPMRWDEIIGQRAAKDYKTDDLISW